MNGLVFYSIGILVLSNVTSVAYAYASAFFHGQSFILPTVAAGDMFKRCSRDAPKDVDGFWTASSKQVAQMETYLGAYMYAHPRDFDAGAPANRQYVGFKRGDKPYIYGNFYPQLPDSEVAKQAKSQSWSATGG